MQQDNLNSISGYLSKLLRKNFGRGPESCHSIVWGKFLLISVKGFISPMEEILVEQRQNYEAKKVRTIIINHVLDQLEGVVEISLQCEMLERYHDWNYLNNSGLIIFLLNREIGSAHHALDLIHLDKLESEVARISLLVEKVPEIIHVYPVSPTIYIVERKGILVPIEKALIAKGFEEELRITKDELEKAYFHKHGQFQQIFNKGIKEIFIDWNFKRDKSLMGFIINE